MIRDYPVGSKFNGRCCIYKRHTEEKTEEEEAM